MSVAQHLALKNWWASFPRPPSWDLTQFCARNNCVSQITASLLQVTAARSEGWPAPAASHPLWEERVCCALSGPAGDGCVCVSHSVMPDSLRSHGLQSTRFLCPWDFLVKDTGVGCHFLLEGIFPTQGSNPCLLCLLHCRWILYPLTNGETCNYVG